MRERLRAFLDSTELGTIIATSNNLHLLDDPFKDRFRKLHIVRPTAQDWVQRAQTVMASEGVNLATQQVSMLLNGFEGSARNMMDWLEDYVFALKRNATFSALPATAVGCVKPAPGVSLINGKPSLRH
jgi:hypothetical protein